MNKLMRIVVTVFTHHVVKLFQFLNSLTLLTLMCRRVTCRQSQITDSAEYVHISAPVFHGATKSIRTEFSALLALLFC